MGDELYGEIEDIFSELDHTEIYCGEFTPTYYYWKESIYGEYPTFEFDFTLYREWSNRHGGKKPTPD